MDFSLFQTKIEKWEIHIFLDNPYYDDTRNERKDLRVFPGLAGLLQVIFVKGKALVKPCPSGLFTRVYVLAEIILL